MRASTRMRHLTWAAARLDGAGLAGEDCWLAEVSPGPGRLAGRDPELAALRRWLAQARAGQGRLVVLAGPPGIGKTRLAEELAEEVRRSGQRVLWGRAVQEEGTPPLWPWRRILGAVGGVDDDAGLTGGGGAALMIWRRPGSGRRRQRRMP